MLKRNPTDITDMFFDRHETFFLPEDAKKYFATVDKSSHLMQDLESPLQKDYLSSQLPDFLTL